jgi:integrase
MTQARQSNKLLAGTRIVEKSGRFYFMPKEAVLDPATGKVGKSHMLCTVAEGPARAKARWSEITRTLTAASSTIAPAHEKNFVAHMKTFVAEAMIERAKEWKAKGGRGSDANTRRRVQDNELERMFLLLGEWFAAFDVETVTPLDIKRAIKEYIATRKKCDGLNQARKLHGRLLMFFSWAVTENIITMNPAREVTTKKPVPKREILTPVAYDKALVACAVGKNGQPIPSGAMIVAYIKLSYLTMQRCGAIRLLKWADCDFDKKLVYFLPEKTRDSSGLKVAIPMTPEIEDILRSLKPSGPVHCLYVIHTTRHLPYSHSGIYTAVRRARLRVGGIDGMTLQKIRPMAATAARKAGASIEQLQTTLAHTNPQQTLDYLWETECPVSELTLTLPKRVAKPR